jgi:DNA-binding response OmpR family regulator
MTQRVLIVEDDPLIAMDLETIAAETGAVPTVCSSVREALERLEAAEFALALLDIDVTDGQTFGVARRLKERQVPVCFVSAVRSADIPADIADTPLVAKPYRVAELKERIRSRA